jgi:peptidoglycan/xylan/chitin deacetylase (PgdA/CDA1 family)
LDGHGIGEAGMTNVPILMYHSISDHRQWLWGHLSCPVAVFEDHARALAEAGFHAISLQAIYDHAARGAALPPRPIVLTFDDGYLDNWVYAAPILKRYGLTGTTFVSTDFVDPAPDPRPTLDDVAAGRVARTALPQTGFLSWAEMAALEAAGVMDIQSHAQTHTWYFSDTPIVDFHRPGDGYPWLAWNAQSARKYRWMGEDQAEFVPWGTPVHTHAKALAVRRYFPDPRLAEYMTTQVATAGGAMFFQEPDWQVRLTVQAKAFRAHNELHDVWESEDAYRARLRSELAESKTLIESRLRKTVRFLCWPGGGYSAEAEQVATETGYLATTLASGDPRRATPAPQYLIRTGAPTLPRHGKTLYRDGRYLVAMLRCRQGDQLACWTCKALTARDMVKMDAGRILKRRFF